MSKVIPYILSSSLALLSSFLLDERTISGVDFIEMTLKGGIVASVHTAVTFQDFNGLERMIFCAHTQEGEGLVPRSERHAHLFEVRTRTYA